MLALLKKLLHPFLVGALVALAANLTANKAVNLAKAQAAGLTVGAFLVGEVGALASKETFLAPFVSEYEPMLQAYVATLPANITGDESKLYDEIVAWVVKEEANV